MLAISEVVKQLNNFTKEKLTQTYADYVINRFNQLDSLSNIAIESLTDQLNQWLGNNNLSSIKHEGLTFNDVLYNALLALAAAKPVNTIDPITQEEFTYNKFVSSESKLTNEDKESIKNRLVISTRHQFDIVTLAEWIRSKGAMINPLTGKSFNKRDIETIKNLAKQLSISLASEHKVDEPHPALLAGAIEIALGQASEPVAQNIPQAVVQNIPQQTLFPFYPVHIQLLAEDVGLPASQVWNLLQTSPQDFGKLNLLSKYIRNFNNNQVPALSRAEALATSEDVAHKLSTLYHCVEEGLLTMLEVRNCSDQEFMNYITAYPYIQEGYLTVIEARALTDEERLILAHGGSEEIHQACFEQLQVYRASLQSPGSSTP